ncbi:Protocadherin Gamma-A11 [Manis pentadactyla]|nr:Protocadherin Gamma-A11 [Manis pentadactyla]
MAYRLLRLDCRGLVLFYIFLGTLRESGAGQIRYSVPEETDKGFFVGNISKDLGLEPWELAERRVRIISRGKTQLFALNQRSGSLITAGRIDREELCETVSSCFLNMEVLVEDTLKIYGLEVEILDINDNAPSFQEEEVEIKVSEHVTPGWRFPLPKARDPDVGMNSLQRYQLNPNSYFSLQMRGGADGAKNPELVLEGSLDRENEAAHRLLLTAIDGGDPILQGAVPIRVVVLDVNDHIPKFTQPVYGVSVPENLSSGTRVLVVKATDPDEGLNGEVAYSFRNMESKASEMFQLDSRTGEVLIQGSLDFEKCRFYEMEIQSQDGGGLSTTAKILITVLDVNDNVPEITITSSTNSVLENSPPGTVIALLNVQDQDSGENGQVSCFILNDLPFKLEKTYGNYYKLLTNTVLDREQVQSYNITLTATDQGSPPLSTETHIALNVADDNDNPPTFAHSSYSAYIPENNPRGASFFSVTALDLDSKENAQVTYSLAEDTVQGVPLSSYISINSNSGVLHALHSFDYEQFHDLQLWVTALDSGDPPLSSNVSLSLFILDQNDNAPQILYPTLPTDGSTGVELAPRSAEPGYLVTKVVAVDRDSGQNAWLSFRLLKASEPGLFAVGLHTGEVRTARALLDRDALKQSLVVAVQDHGQPPLSATVTLTVAVADSIPDVLADLDSMKAPADPDASGLTLYLVVAVAAVSCVFLAFVIVLLALRLRRWHASRLLPAVGGGLVGVGASPFVGVDGVRAFLQTYSHEVSLTADSRESHVIFPQPNYADTLVSQESCGKSEPLLIAEDSATDLSKCDPRSNQVQFSYGLHYTCNNNLLDREQTPEYNVTITATDRGKPPLFSNRTVNLIVADVNDNAPVFQQASYVVHVAENNPPGASIAQVSASDPDLGPNGHVSYSIVASDLEPRALRSYVSVSAQSGAVFAQRAFDHEQLRAFELTLQARDQGSPALGANVSLRVLVGDRNDNAPRVLYPALGPDGSALFDTVPRAAQPGYLVTKVVAVDADSGHNAWLSYHVLQASEPGLFSLGLRTGEVRTARALGDRDAARQRLLVAVRDGGQPPLSATATLHLVFADSLQDVLPDLSDRPTPSDPQAELQFYLVLALALISVLFLLAVILAIALRLQRSCSLAT